MNVSHRTYLRVAIAWVAGFALSCERPTAPTQEPALNVELAFPDSTAAPARRAKPAGRDTVLDISRMNLMVTQPGGEVLFHGPFERTSEGWRIEAVLRPAPHAIVRVDAWHHDALMYQGYDSTVSILPGRVATARIQLASFLPEPRITIKPITSGPFALSVNPRASRDPVHPSERLTIRYDWEDDGVWDTQYLILAPLTHQYSGPGTYTVRAEIVNPTGLVGQATASAAVALWLPPPQALFTVHPAEGPVGADFVIDATPSFSTRPELDSLTVRWDFDGDGVWDTPWYAEATARTTLTSPGTIPATLQVRDKSGQTAIGRMPVIVVPATAEPTARLWLSPIVARTGDLVAADAGHSQSRVADPTMRFRWDFDGDGTWDGGWSDSSRAAHTFGAPGTYTVRVAVMNVAGETAVAEAGVYVEQSNPFAPGEEHVVNGVSMRYVPAGSFRMGTHDYASVDELPVHEEEVRAFLMDTYEVTNAEYRRFVLAVGHPAPPHWIGTTYPFGSENLPVVNVSWSDAVAYAEWRGCRLPTEAEWEYAARGTDGRPFPWGASAEPLYANYGPGEIVEIGAHPRGASPFAIHDMAGNVAEWTSDRYLPYTGFGNYTLVSPTSGVPAVEGNTLYADNPFISPLTTYRVARGGAVGSDRSDGSDVKATTRSPVDPDAGSPVIGFRCVRRME